MSWAKIDDQFHSNEKALSCSLAARGLWTTCLSWVADKETDGNVPKAIVRLHAGPQWQELSDELVESGLWSETASGWAFHDYLTYNPSRSSLEEERRRAAERKASWKAKSQQDSTRRNTDGTLTQQRHNGDGTPVGQQRNTDGTATERRSTSVPSGGGTEHPDPDPVPEVTKVTSTPIPPVGDVVERYPSEACDADHRDAFTPEELAVESLPHPPRMTEKQRAQRDADRTAVMAAFRRAKYSKPITDPIMPGEFEKLRQAADDLLAGNITPDQVEMATVAALTRWSEPSRVTLRAIAGNITDLIEPVALSPTAGRAAEEQPRGDDPVLADLKRQRRLAQALRDEQGARRDEQGARRDEQGARRDEQSTQTGSRT